MVRVAEAAMQIMGRQANTRFQSRSTRLCLGVRGTLWTVLFLLTREVPGEKPITICPTGGHHELGTFLDGAVQKFGRQPYIQFYEETITYEEFGKRVNILANALKESASGRGLHSRPRAEQPNTLIAYFAIQKIGPSPVR